MQKSRIFETWNMLVDQSFELINIEGAPDDWDIQLVDSDFWGNKDMKIKNRFVVFTMRFTSKVRNQVKFLYFYRG